MVNKVCILFSSKVSSESEKSVLVVALAFFEEKKSKIGPILTHETIFLRFGSIRCIGE